MDLIDYLSELIVKMDGIDSVLELCYFEMSWPRERCRTYLDCVTEVLQCVSFDGIIRRLPCLFCFSFTNGLFFVIFFCLRCFLGSINPFEGS